MPRCASSGVSRLARTRLSASTVFLAMVLASSSARAQSQDGLLRARAAYDEGVEAYKAKDYARAASAFSLADDLSPNDVALREAISAAKLADDAPLSMQLVERAEKRPLGGELVTLVRATRGRFASRAGRLRVHCISLNPSFVNVDGKSVSPNMWMWVTTGEHDVRCRFASETVRRALGVVGEGVHDVTVRDPAEVPSDAATVPVPAEPKQGEKTAPAATSGADTPAARRSFVDSPVFWGGVVVSTALLGVTTWSAFDTSRKHQSFVDDGCPRQGNAQCSRLSSDGESAQVRTNALIGATIGASLATVVVAWVVAPKAASSSRVSYGASSSGRGLSLALAGEF